VQIIFIEDK